MPTSTSRTWQATRWRTFAGRYKRSSEGGSSLMLTPSLSFRSHSQYSRLCAFRWQRNLNPKPDEDPHHHDVAILVTRKNICSNHGCA